MHIRIYIIYLYIVYIYIYICIYIYHINTVKLAVKLIINNVLNIICYQY